jgi:cob(I)alamin adenosyltransferase
MKKKGLIQVYTGAGKGKSTAAIGQAARAAGHGFKVGFISFFKDPEVFGYGEYKSLKKLGVKTFLFAKKHPHFYKELNPDDVCQECSRGLEFIKELFQDPSWDMLVLSLLETKPEKLELVLTGRGVTEKIIEKADLVSEVREVKHPYSQGIKSREGIEY